MIYEYVNSKSIKSVSKPWEHKLLLINESTKEELELFYSSKIINLLQSTHFKQEYIWSELKCINK